MMFLFSEMDLHELAIELFCRFDPDHKGYITQDQLLNGSMKDDMLSEGQIISVFTLLDKDEKGIITLSDFTDAFIDISVVNNLKSTRRISEREPVFTNEKALEKTKSGNEYCDKRDGDCMHCPCGQSTLCHSKLKVRCCAHDKSLKPCVSTETLNDIFDVETSHEDGTSRVRHVNKRLFGLRKFSGKRRVSLPTVTDRKVVESIKIGSLLKTRQWKSYECGIDKCCMIIEKDNKLKSSIDNVYLDTKAPLNTDSEEKRIDQKHEISKKISREISDGYCEETNLEETNIHASKELDEIFGTTDKLNTNIKSCEVCNENRNTIPINKTERKASLDSTPNNGQSSRLDQINNNNLSNLVHKCEINNGISKVRKTKSPRKNGYYTNQHVDESGVGSELFVSHVEEGKNFDNFIEEEWKNYLGRLGGVSLFSGNCTLRYLWHQIKSYQTDLASSFDKFLRSVIEDQKSIYARCQETESTLHLKMEQHEEEITNLYEEFDIARELEFEEMQKKHNEREEYIKNEFRKIIEFKEQAYQECCKQMTVINERLEGYEEEISSIQALKRKSEEQCKMLSKEQRRYLAENELLSHENEILKENYKVSHDTVVEMQDQLNQLRESAKIEKAKHRSFLQHYNDIIDEKSFLETSLVNLSMENEELRCLTRSRRLDNNDNINLELSDLPLSSSSPLKAQRSFSSHQLMSLHEEMNISYGRKLSTQISYDEVIHETQHINKRKQKNLQKNDSFNITHHYIKCDSLEISNIEKETAANKLVSNYHVIPGKKEGDEHCKRTTSNGVEPRGIHLAAPTHSNFKVIVCGDSNVGKTSLICRICFGTFTNSHQQTQTIDTYTKVIDNGGHDVKLKIWDTVGQERYSSLPTSYYRQSDVAVIMYDVNVKKSFHNVKMWLANVQKFSENNVIVIVGSKIDLGDLQRNVSKQEGKSFAKENGAIFIETSSKTGENIEKLLNSIAVALCLQNEFVMIQNYFEQSHYQANTSRRQCCN